MFAPGTSRGARRARCGTVEVFEDRQARRGRRLRLRVLVVPALSPDHADPLFFVAGGPGQSATKLGPQLLPSLRRINRERDLVFVDQRGTGASNPLECEPDLDPAAELQELFRVDINEALFDQCRSSYDADLTHYATPTAMDDLDQVRRALGYERINLLGGSYGTRAALVYLRRHPEQVRSLIVDGVAPVSMRMPLHLGEDSARALRLTFEACAADPACQKRYPRLRQHLDELLARLGQQPESVRVAHPRTGQLARVTVHREAVAGLLRGALYASEFASLLPHALEQAHQRHYEPLVAIGLAMTETAKLALGMHWTVLCAEDVARISQAEANGLEGEPLLGSSVYSRWKRFCARWPKATLPERYWEPVSSDKPILILSGALDPATPPRWGEAIAKHLSNARHIVVPGVAHGTFMRGCLPRLLAQFLHDPKPRAIDPSCVRTLARTPFTVDHYGPPP